MTKEIVINVLYMTLIFFSIDVLLILFDKLMNYCSTAFEDVNPSDLKMRFKL